MRFDIVTLFPEMFDGYLGQSLLHKAIQSGLCSVHLHNLRDWTFDKHNSVDDRPFGGGPGMVLMVEPLVNCVEEIQSADDRPGRILMMTPQGTRLSQTVIEQLASGQDIGDQNDSHRGDTSQSDVDSVESQPTVDTNEDVSEENPITATQRFILLCGRYEGFDQRVIDILQPDEVSIGDYILNGSEVAAMVMVDSLVRMVPGVLGDERSSVEDSFSRGNRMLEYPQYTRPREFRGHSVPDVLLNGNHPEIARWREQQSLKKTRERRADLLRDSDN